MKRQLTVLLTQIAVTCVLVMPVVQWAQAQQTVLPPGEAAKAYARARGPAGSPQYAAALRDALSRATDLMDITRESATRSISQADLATSNAPSSPVLRIDRDPDYVKWLEEQAGTNLYAELHLEGEEPVKMRSVGGAPLFSRTLFAEVGVTVQPQPLAGYCSGVLMDRKTMLTAAHCVCQYKPEHMIMFGTSIASRDRYAAKIKSIKTRAKVDCANETSVWQSVRGNDIAVVRLQEEVPEGFVRDIAPIADPDLISTEFKKLNRVLWTVGYGMTERNPPGDKNVSLVPILSFDCSRQGDHARYGCVVGKEILAKDPRAIGPCGGDSGGGAYLVVEQTINGKSYKKPWLVGLVSGSTINPQVQCGDAAIFTLLTKDALEWARRNAVD